MAMTANSVKVTAPPTSDISHVQQYNPIYTLCIICSLWLLGYYLLPDTFFARISPGGLVMESPGSARFWLVFIAGTISCAFILFALISAGGVQFDVKYPPLWLLSLIFCMPALATLAMSQNNIDRALGMASLLIAISAGVIAAQVVRRAGQLIAAVSLVAFIQAAYTIVYQREQIHLLLSGSVYRAGGTFNNPNELYVLMLVALPFAIVGVIRSKTNITRIAYLIASSMEFAALVLTWQRAGAVGLAVSFTALCYMVSRSKRLTILILVSLVTLSGIVLAVRMEGMRDAASISGSNLGRIHVWRAGLEVFSKNPIIGQGVGSFNIPVVTQRGAQTNYNRAEEPKNLLLDWLAERGAVGGLLFILFVWSIFGTIKRSLPNSLAAATGAAWLGLLTIGIVDTPFGVAERYAGNCCFGLLLGVTALLPHLCEAVSKTSSYCETQEN